MAYDRTQHQSSEEVKKAQRLSLTAAAPPRELPGYRMIRHLGSGAYGEVWAADDLKTGRRVAIKFYVGKSGTDVAQLAGEVEKLALLGADRYVVQLLNVDWESNPPYYVMDYLENGSLEERLSNNQTMPLTDALELFKELAIGMMHMHNKGIFHCDLKPGNVMLDQEGKPRIADFGQSRLSSGDRPALGTLFFMAPEQADLQAVPDARWDVYGLGALLFCMLTGRPPYYSSTLVKKIDQATEIEDRLANYRAEIQRAPKPTEHRLAPGVDRSLADIIDRCIAANPNQRFDNISSLLVALSQREIARTRRPLMVLGLIGPMLLIGLMSLFGWEAFRRSVKQTQEEITKKAIESNLFASQLAARSASEQMKEYFRSVHQLSRDAELISLLEQVVADPQIQRWLIELADPANNSIEGLATDAQPHPIVLTRENLRQHPLRQQLQPLLEERLWNQSGEFPESASWFICDRWGNQIASAFRETNQTLGKNYAYRTYFTGLDADLPISDFSTLHLEPLPKSLPDPLSPLELGIRQQSVLDDLKAQRSVIPYSHLSAAFRSDQSNSWKVAFSSPVMANGQIIGVVAVTVELGGMVEFVNQRNHYAILIDDRPGETQGIILEHPLHQRVLAEQGRLPEELGRLIVDLDDAKRRQLFFDPVGGTDIGKEYFRPSVIGVSPVLLRTDRMPQTTFEPPPSAETPSETTRVDNLPTGLVVMALENYAEVVAPVDGLIAQWRVLALLASSGLLLVSMVMWLFVRRLLHESRQRLERVFSPSSTELLSFQHRDTVPANSRPTIAPKENAQDG